MNFSGVMFYENYLTSDFHTNTVISSLFAYSSTDMASKTVIRPFLIAFATSAFLALLLIINCAKRHLLAVWPYEKRDRTHAYTKKPFWGLRVAVINA